MVSGVHTPSKLTPSVSRYVKSSAQIGMRSSLTSASRPRSRRTLTHSGGSASSAPADVAKASSIAAASTRRMSVQRLHVVLVEVLVGQLADGDLAVVEDRAPVATDGVGQGEPRRQ